MPIDKSNLNPGAARNYWHQKEAESFIADDLRRFLDLVWSHRVDHKTGKIRSYVNAYNIYSRGGPMPGFELIQTKTFLTQLATLPEVPEIQASATDRGLGQWLVGLRRAYPVASGFIGMPAVEFQKLTLEAQSNDSLAQLLSYAFFHFRKYLGGSSHRIYLHAKPTHGPEVMRFLLRSVVPLNGVSNAKVAPPSAIERYDTIVIYMADSATVDAGLSRIAEFQKGNSGLFDHGTPRLLKPIPEFRGVQLVGVATGAEPRFDLEQTREGSLRRVDRNSSFGLLRSTIIEYCLKWTVKRGDDKTDFIDDVVTIMQKVGIDPRAPYNG